MNALVKPPGGKKLVGKPFEPGNRAAANADHSARRICTQQLKTILAEEFQEWDPERKRFKPAPRSPAGSGITKLRKMLDNLVFNATVLGDVVAIKEIMDRVEGKPVQAIAAEGPGGERLEATTFIVRFSDKPPSSNDEGGSAPPMITVEHNGS